MTSSAAHPDPRPARALWSGTVPVLLNAGSRRSVRASRAVRSRLAERGTDADVHVLAGAEIMAALDEITAARPPLVVVGGGDGTVAAAAARLAHTGTVLGVLPLGTANDFARTVHLPRDPARAVDVLLDGQVVDVDLGRVEPDVPTHAPSTFLNVASCGLSVALTERLSPRLKRALGPAAYPLAAVRAYRGHEAFDARLEFPDGDHAPIELAEVLQLSIGNGRHYGGGNTVAPEASVDDSVLDVYAVVHAPLREHARLVRRLRDGTVVHHSKVVHVTTPAVRITTSRSLLLNLDGEIGASTPVTVRTDPDAVDVIIPTESRAARYDGRRRGRRHLD